MSNFDNDPDYEECIVTFLDILGFRDLVTRRSAGEIRKVLNVFRQEARPYSPYKDEEQEDPKKRRLISEVHMEIVSDAIVRARTIYTEYQDGALFHELMDLLHTQVACIWDGILVRGAVTIDYIHVGKDLKGPLFGPGLISAYLIEENKAIYPRIVMEEDIIKRLKEDRSLWKEGHTKHEEMGYLSELVKSDEAGLLYINYLHAIKTEMEDYTDYLRFLQRHKQLIKEGSSVARTREVKMKYTWLKEYHNKQVADEMNTSPIDEFIPDWECTPRDALEPLLID